MCGIGGMFCPRGEPPAIESLRAMGQALRHRGPDEFGIYRDAHAGLAHARLSIIDLSTGQQPLSNEDGTLWIAFNGEIFNYVELREELIALGHSFRTRSDTEVIVHAWEAWREAAFERFNGQWAIALWDARAQELILSRDRLGVRPLMMAQHGGRLLFGSTVRALFAADPSLPRAIDPVGLAETFTFWSTVPPRTVFQGIEELPPGHVRIVSASGVREHRYWHPHFPADFAGSIDDAAEATRAALEQAVTLRMLRADVPVGSYLSGGLDSSLVAALAVAKRGDQLQTFSLRFEDAEYDETRWQRQMAERLGSRHHEVTVTRADIAASFPDVVLHTERPILRTAPAPMYLLSKLVREHGIKVVLTGEGADETFAGYDLFREAKVRRFWARRPESRMRPRLLERLYPYLSRSPVSQEATARLFFGRDLDRSHEPGFSHGPRWTSTAALLRLLAPAMRSEVDVAAQLIATLPSDYRTWTLLAQDQYLEMRTLLCGYILASQGDRMLMAHSIEGRFPFLDPNVVALAASLPPEHKLRVLDEKHVLKRVARELVPAEILRRPKQPYRAPDALSFVAPSRPAWIDEVMADDTGIFEPRAVAMLWKKCRERGDRGQFSNADNMALVGVLSTQLLHRHFIRSAPPISEGRLEPLKLVDALA